MKYRGMRKSFRMKSTLDDCFSAGPVEENGPYKMAKPQIDSMFINL